MLREACVNKKLNEESCPCDNTKCERHGVCCLCIRHHKNNREYPACLR